MWLVVTNFLVSASFVLVAVHVGQGHDVPVNIQKDKCYSLFCNFLSLYEWTLKGQSFENRLSCIFQTIGNILL